MKAPTQSWELRPPCDVTLWRTGVRADAMQSVRRSLNFKETSPCHFHGRAEMLSNQFSFGVEELFKCTIMGNSGF
jgi:hypothetical protein